MIRLFAILWLCLPGIVNAAFPAGVGRIHVGEKQIRLIGVAGPGWTLSSYPIGDFAENTPALLDVKLDRGFFEITVPRFSGDRDLLLSRWRVKDAKGEFRSPFHYADEISCRAPDLPKVKPRTKKGLGGWFAGPFTGELDELGIDAFTVNVVVNELVSLQPEEGTTPFIRQGKTYHARLKNFERLDETFRQAEKRGAVVSAILLIANPAKGGDETAKLLGHPDAVKDGHYAMPNLASTDGADFYGAILDFMADRWCRAKGPHGRVHHWIMHNEVDAGWEWTNAGTKTDVEYMDLYHRSMRLMSLIARKYDPHSKPLISLTHHWADKGRAEWYGSKRMLELLADHDKKEGSFPWGVAFHPYPQDLTEPKTWDDDQATPGFDTRKITPKNIEVLDAWMKQPRFLFHGKPRPVHLSENGFNSRDYSEKSLAEQAAGMAFAWTKIKDLKTIESWEYHNWIDNRAEGGLRIGLRKFSDEPGDPAGTKPIWVLYRSLGTKDEKEMLSRHGR